MKAKVVYKNSGAERAAAVENLVLDRPSVVVLKLAPEKVMRYVRRGDDLVLVLQDGTEILVHGFFIQYQGEGQEQAAENASAFSAENGRNDLVLIDDNGVVWWGQYPETWSEFYFAEIEWDAGGAPIWGDSGSLLPWLLAGLGAAGAGALIAGGGSGGKKDASGGNGQDNRAPLAVDDAVTTKGAGINGNVLANDSDPDGDALKVTQFVVNGVTYNAGDTAVIAGVGSLVIKSDGSYTFTPAPNWTGTVPTATYTVSDGKSTDTANLTVTVTPGVTSGNTPSV